ncbi:DUF1566 domain-containing protein [Niveibacterium sp. 24ML]|uniref:Lcl domain-containing protein n=1 Tax=Niveibacterium sp. 24ML TaxID=2985512 RepID=UPI00227182C4|nr:DUF1566 domain-containing protein [Niveibacterium sp. 24ML]MCX9155422.1 DUF1566 domain-containing protein [Niveibacterium sp. 24ML]
MSPRSALLLALFACAAAAQASATRYEVADGAIRDARSGLVWAQEDNGSEIGWQDARDYCARRGPGWRLPTLDELEALYDPAESVACGANFCHASSNFVLSGGWFWSSEPSGETHAWGYNLDIGRRDTAPVSGGSFGRVLCVS